MSIEDDLPSTIRELLRESGHEGSTPFSRKIFTNRDLDLENIPVIGFDMDYTLAMYHQDALEQLSIEVTVQKLIARGYPECLADIRSVPGFAICGLVVDRQLGNLLKMDRHGYVGRVYHGKRMLARPERKKIYRAQRISQQRTRYGFVDTGFSLPEVTIYAELVELIDKVEASWSGRSRPSYEEAWNDVREAMDESHRDDSIKQIIRANPSSYFRKDPDLAPTLHKLRSSGKRLFLLTNSFFPYSDAVLSHLLNGEIDAYEDWTVYFDWMIVGSGKPGFFNENRPFQEVDRRDRKVGSPKDKPQRGKIYQAGNQTGLQMSLGVEADEVLYVGDHIYGDIVQSKKNSGWRTALIVDDLERDLIVRRDYQAALREVASVSRIRDELNEEVSAQRHLQRALSRLTAEDVAKVHNWDSHDPRAKSLLDDALARSKRRFDRLRAHGHQADELLELRCAEVDAAFNPYWGSVFSERRDSSLYGAQLENYACVYTSRVSNFLYVSPVRYFHAPHGSMPHWQVQP